MDSGPGGVGRVVIKTQRGVVSGVQRAEMANTPSDSVQAAFGDTKGPKRISGASFRRAASRLSAQCEEVGPAGSGEVGAGGDTAPDAGLQRPGQAGQTCPAPGPRGFLTAGGSVSPVLKPLCSQGSPLGRRESGSGPEWWWVARRGGDPSAGPPGVWAAVSAGGSQQG